MLLGVVISRNINDDDDDIWEYFSKYESKKSYFYKKKIYFSIFNNVYGMRRTACNKSFFSPKYLSIFELRSISEYKLVSEFKSKSGCASLTLYKSKSIIPKKIIDAIRKLNFNFFVHDNKIILEETSFNIRYFFWKIVIPNLNKNIEVTCESPLNQENNVIHFKLK